MTMVLAHRGSKGTHPENTLAAFKEAVRVKSEGIELDVQLSLDNHLVVIHDGEVDRTTNGQGLVKEYTLKELKEFDAGSWFHEDYNKETIPTFEEVIALLDESDYKGLLNIEIKTDEYDYEGIEEKVLKVITSKEYPFTIMLSSFNTETMKRLIALNNTFEKAIILDNSKRKIAFCEETTEISGMHPSIEWIKGNIETVKGFSEGLRPWTINSTEDMTLCFELGITGFHTDFPEKAMQLKESLS